MAEISGALSPSLMVGDLIKKKEREI